VTLANDNIRRSVQNEIAVMRAVKDCPYVVKIINAEMGTARAYLILRLYSEGDLFDHIYKTCPDYICDPELVYEVGRDISIALSCVHKAGFIHCDVKPENILVDYARGRRSTFHLADFGLVKRIGDSSPTITGTLRYLPPETKESPKRDVWALGVILYEMAYGGLPYAMDSREFHEMIKGGDPIEVGPHPYKLDQTHREHDENDMDN
jgi:serine/threonine protein kinase